MPAAMNSTAASLRTQHSTTVNLIMMANQLDDYALYVYQRLIIPPSGWQGWPQLGVWTGPTPGNPSGGGTYVVQPGDTLYSIARRFSTTVAALQAANGLTGTFIRAGMTLRLP